MTTSYSDDWPTNTTWPRPAARYAQYVRKLSRCGHWTLEEVRGSHVVLKHVDSDATVAYNTHQGGNDKNSARNFATQAQRICGCSIIECRNRRRSRKPPQISGFSIERAKREARGFHDSWDAQIARLHAQHDELVEQAHELARAGDATSLHECAATLAQITDVEQQLVDDFHQPVDRFDPYDLAQYR